MSRNAWWTGKSDLIRNLVSRELKSRYKSSVLGLLWSLLTPLLMAVIYVVFLRLLSRGVPLVQVIIGVFAWTFTVQAVQTGMECITGNSNLVKKVFFPRMLLPLSTTLAALVNFGLSLLIQFALLAVMLWGDTPGWDVSVWMLPLVVVYHFGFNLALALLFGAANVYFRDTQHLVSVFLSAWFFMSPAMYHLGFVEAFADDRPWVLSVYMLNPMACIITAYRSLILSGVDFPWSGWACVGWIWPILLLPLAVWVFRRAQRNFADFL